MVNAILAAALSDRTAVRRALALERMRIRQCHMAVTSATEGSQGAAHKLHASLNRAAALTLLLIDMGEAIPMNALSDELNDLLLDAMNANLRRGHARSRRRASIAKPVPEDNALVAQSL